MRFTFLPREEKFFDLFDEAAIIISRASGKFLDMVSTFDRLAARSNELKLEEHACDEAVGRIIKALDRSFITPFDREDIHTLAAKLDDIMDNMEETANRFVVFRIQQPTSEAVVLARIIQDCCGHLAKAIHLLRSLKNGEEIQKHVR